VLGVPGCRSTSSNRNAPAASATAPGPVSKEDNPIDVLSRAISAQLEAKSFRARMLTAIDSGKESTRMVECVAPDRFHITGDQDEMIMAGGNVYMKSPGGEWTRLLFDPTEMMNQIRDTKQLDEIRKSTDVALVGDDTVEGVPTLVYRYSMKDPFGMRFTGNCKMWVGLTDSLPRKMEVEGEFNKMKTRSVVTYYDYGANIRIEPPASYKTQGGR
jgi:hypothetical protein